MKPANLCRPCGEDFASLEAFDEHHVGEYEFTFSEGLHMDPPREDGWRCLTVNEMLERGWQRDRHGRWIAPTPANVDLARVEL